MIVAEECLDDMAVDEVYAGYEGKEQERQEGCGEKKTSNDTFKVRRFSVDGPPCI